MTNAHIVVVNPIPQVARNLRFAPSVMQLADKVLARLGEASQGRGFNGAHMRIEKDATDWMGARASYYVSSYCFCAVCDKL